MFVLTRFSPGELLVVNHDVPASDGLPVFVPRTPKTVVRDHDLVTYRSTLLTGLYKVA